MLKKKMKNKFNLMLGMIVLLSLLPVISAVTQPTQQFNKIFLSPFYSTTLNKDIPYSYSLYVNVPDGVSEVVSALISFQIYATSSGQDYSLLINGESCNNPTFVATEKGLTFPMFDCSNIIDGNGFYDISIISSKESGSAIGWLDFTYKTDPVGEMHVWGTEYRAGEKARVFLQLRDAQGLPEDNGDCHVDIYYPQQINFTAQVFVDDAPMLHLTGSEGIYYYDITTLPNVTGVYMMTAGCNYELSNAFVYYADGTDSYSPIRNNSLGTTEGSTIVLNAYTDYVYEKCVASGGATKYCQSNYTFETSVHFNDTSSITDLGLYYMGEASLPATLYFEVWNWTNSSFYTLPNTLIFSGNSPVSPIGLNDFVSNSIPDIEDFIDNSSGDIIIRMTAGAGSSFQMYSNWLNINLKTASGTVQSLKGSSEIHINDWFDYYRQSYTDSVWENFTGNITPNVLNQIANASAYETWQYNDTINPSILSQISSSVWDLFNNTYNFIGSITESVWSYVDRNLTYTEDVTNYSKVAEYVWTYGDRNLTFYQVSNLTPEDIWTYTSRNLTFTEDVTNYSSVAEYVWLYVDRNLTTQEISNFSIEKIWSYYNRSLTEDIPLEIWSYPNRNLTTDIPFEVWSYYNRTLTYYTLNLTDLINQVNDYEFDQALINMSMPSDYYYQPSTLNVVLYVEK